MEDKLMYIAGVIFAIFGAQTFLVIICYFISEKFLPFLECKYKNTWWCLPLEILLGMGFCWTAVAMSFPMSLIFYLLNKKVSSDMHSHYRSWNSDVKYSINRALQEEYEKKFKELEKSLRDEFKSGNSWALHDACLDAYERKLQDARNQDIRKLDQLLLVSLEHDNEKRKHLMQYYFDHDGSFEDLCAHVRFFVGAISFDEYKSNTKKASESESWSEEKTHYNFS